MKITLDITDTAICAFLNGVEVADAGLQMFSYQIGGDDLVDGNTIKLPRDKEDCNG